MKHCAIPSVRERGDGYVREILTEDFPVGVLVANSIIGGHQLEFRWCLLDCRSNQSLPGSKGDFYGADSTVAEVVPNVLWKWKWAVFGPRMPHWSWIWTETRRCSHSIPERWGSGSATLEVDFFDFDDCWYEKWRNKNWKKRSKNIMTHTHASVGDSLDFRFIIIHWHDKLYITSSTNTTLSSLIHVYPKFKIHQFLASSEALHILATKAFFMTLILVNFDIILCPDKLHTFGFTRWRKITKLRHFFVAFLHHVRATTHGKIKKHSEGPWKIHFGNAEKNFS